MRAIYLFTFNQKFVLGNLDLCHYLIFCPPFKVQYILVYRENDLMYATWWFIRPVLH